MNRLINPHAILQIEQIERAHGLAGKRVADVPKLAGFRRKYRWRFYRLAELGMFLSIANVLLAAWPGNPVWWLSLFALGLSGAMVLLGEMSARLLTHQLKRRAAEQIWLDLNGLHHV